MNAHSFTSIVEQAASLKVACAAQCHQPRTGLTATEVLTLRAEHGRNELPAENPTAAWAILFSQFKSPLVYIILVAAVPEGLLIAVTVILVLGMRKILKRNGLVRCWWPQSPVAC